MRTFCPPLLDADSRPPTDDLRFAHRGRDAQRDVFVSDTIFCLLGTRDPAKVRDWIFEAREIAACEVRLRAAVLRGAR